MLKIKLAFDQKTYDDTVARFDADMTTGLVSAVNAAAEAARDAVRAEMLSVFDRPTPYTLQGVALYEATPRSDGGDPSALVFLLDDQAAYLELEIAGGPRAAGDYATTRLGPLVPGPAAPRDGFGGLPRGFVASALADPTVSWVTLKPGEPPALVRKVKGQPLEVLALIATKTHYAPRRASGPASVRTRRRSRAGGRGRCRSGGSGGRPRTDGGSGAGARRRRGPRSTAQWSGPRS